MGTYNNIYTDNNTTGGLTLGNIIWSPGYSPNETASPQPFDHQRYLQGLQNLMLRSNSVIEGDKPLVVCGSEHVNCKTMEEAQAKAEELAHKLGQNAYILKPVRKVAPKRDVVTTELS